MSIVALIFALDCNRRNGSFVRNYRAFNAIINKSRDRRYRGVESSNSDANRLEIAESTDDPRRETLVPRKTADLLPDELKIFSS